MHLPAAFPAVAPRALPAQAAAPTLAAVALGGQRGERVLFRDLEMTLGPGQVVWLRGRNGRGKTSLLRLLAGLATPMAGEVRVAGRSIRRAPAAWRTALLYIGHQNSLKDDLTSSEALAFLLRLGGSHCSAGQIDAALQRLGVHACRHALVRTLSQGQRRRVALARLALSLGQPLWLLDEPFDALDADGVAALNELLAEHAGRDGATLLTSHQALSLAEPVPRIFDLDRYVLA